MSRVTFAGFVDNVDAVVRARARAEYGRFVGPHVAYWQYGAISARLREGQAGDVELDIAQRESPLRTTCDARGAQSVAEAILASWS